MFSDTISILKSIVNNIDTFKLSKINNYEAMISNVLSISYEEFYKKKNNIEDYDSFINLIDILKDLTVLLECRKGVSFYLTELQASLMRGVVAGLKKSPGITEKRYEEILIDNWDKTTLGKEYVIVNSQYLLEDGDFIDILAKDKKSNNHVIIELKKGCKNGYKQLRAYSVFFDNPILINISESDVKIKKKGIAYFTFDSIGLF